MSAIVSHNNTLKAIRKVNNSYGLVSPFKLTKANTKNSKNYLIDVPKTKKIGNKMYLDI